MQCAMNVRKTSVIEVKGKKAPALTNEWQDETLKVLDKFEGKTKAEIEKIIKHKVIPFKKI